MLIGLSANSQLRWFQIDQIEKFVNVRRLYSKIKKCLRFVDYKRDRKKLMIEMYFSSKLTNISVVDEDFPARSTISITLSCRYCWQDLTLFRSMHLTSIIQMSKLKRTSSEFSS